MQEYGQEIVALAAYGVLIAVGYGALRAEVRSVHKRVDELREMVQFLVTVQVDKGRSK